MKHQCLKMMEPLEYKERNVIEGNFIRNIKVEVRRQDSTKEMMSLGKDNKKHCSTGAQERIISVHSFNGLSLSRDLNLLISASPLLFTLTAISQLSEP